MSQPVITVENLGKAYRIGLKEQIPDTLVGAATSWIRSPLRNFRRLRKLNTFRANSEAENDIIWALRDVSFEVADGEVLGIIGRNGAGKSTLLKILSRITEPTRGRALIRGRVSSLLEVGTGFHPELSGRENIYMNGTILGMRKKEIDRKLDQIIDFSGVERFLDTPIKRFSSGMKVRLAFSVAAHLEPEILIIDEVLAVGDAEFQAKCLGKMRDVADGGRTVLFVSHNMSAIQQLCTRGIVVRDGQIVIDDEMSNAVQAYIRYLNVAAKGRLEDNPARNGSGDVRLTNVCACDERGSVTDHLVAGRAASFQFEYRFQADISQMTLGFTVFNNLGVACTHINTDLQNVQIDTDKTSGELICYFDRLPLPPGGYRLSVIISANGRQADRILGCYAFEVISSEFYPSTRLPDVQFCPVLFDHQWTGSIRRLSPICRTP